MMQKQNRKILPFLLLLPALLAVGCRLATGTILPSPTPTENLAAVPPSPTAENNWNVYTNDILGFSFEYPVVYDEPAYAECAPHPVGNNNISLGRRSTLDILYARGLELSPFLDQLVQEKGFTVESRREESVSGSPAITVDYRFGGTGRFGTLTVLEREGHIYAFNFTAGPTCDAPERQVTELEAYAQMVRSFQFLESGTLALPATEPPAGSEQVFSSKALGVSFDYPADWRSIEGDPQGYGKYAGEDGYFITNGMAGGGMSLDEVAQSQANHILKPFGSSPTIETLEIAGQPARMILPAPDQQDLVPDMAGMAELIVRYPVPVLSGRSLSEFFVLDADAGHLREMTSSLSFSRKPELYPADADTPAAGICETPENPSVPLVIVLDVPSPRCVKVRPDQLAEITNGTGAEVRFKLAWYELTLQPGETYTFDVPLGVFLAPGVHQMQLSSGSGPEIWLEGN